MKEIIKNLAHEVLGVGIKKGLFSTKVYYCGNELKEYTIYFGPEASGLIGDYVAKESAEILEKLKPAVNGPNLLNVFIDANSSVAFLRISQYVPHKYEPRTGWITKTDNRTCMALRKLIQNSK